LRVRLATLIVLACALAVPRGARADEAADKARAQALFDEGSKLLEEKRFAEACDLLGESRRLAMGLGVTLYLADCYENLGKTATALSLFRDAERLAQARKDKREAVAHERATKLEELTPSVIVHVTHEVDGLAIRLDDAELPRASWGTPQHLDPGEHAVSATAPGRTAFKTKVDLLPRGQTTTVEIPTWTTEEPSRLASANPDQTAPAPSNTRRFHWTEEHVVGVTLGGVGAASLLVAGAFGLVAKSKLDQSNSGGHCRPDDRCDAVGLDLRSRADSAANVANIAAIVGAVAIVAGEAVLVLALQLRRSPRSAAWMIWR
jgi:serine/threonine-protein kinase